MASNNKAKISAKPSLATIIYSESVVNTSETSTGSAWLKSKWTRVVETVILTGVILLVCGLFTIPTILYALPPLLRNEGTSINISCQDDQNDKNASGLGYLNTSLMPGNSQIRCAEGFFLDNSSNPICSPLCKSWLKVTAQDAAFVACLILAIISSIILLSAARIQKDAIMVYPTYYLVYVCVAVFAAAPFFIIGTLLKAKVFCSSDGLIESVNNSSPFCIINGIVGVYLLVQITLLVTFHALGLCWGIMFPFHYRRFKAYDRIKYIHASTVVLGLVLPAIPALLHLIDGYTIGLGHRSVCVGRDMSLNYFFVTLPISILVAVTTSVFVILLWKIFKQFILKKFLLKEKPKEHIGKAEAKIFVIMCYYISLGIIWLSIYAYVLATIAETSVAYQTYFTCQSVGIQSDKDCGDTPDIHLQTFHTLSPVGYFLQSLMPIVILMFIVDWRCIHKNDCCKNEKENLVGKV